MMNHIDHIVEHLFHKKKLDDVSIYELERFIATHPYFAAGHFLLAKKTQISYPERAPEQITTTALYYNNALWLQWLLDQDLAVDRKKQEEKESVSINNNEAVSDLQTIDPVMSADQQTEMIVQSIESNETNEITHIGSSTPDQGTTQVNEFATASENGIDSSISEHEEKTVDALQDNSLDKQIVEIELKKEFDFGSPEQSPNPVEEPEVNTESSMSSDTMTPVQSEEPINDTQETAETITLENSSAGITHEETLLGEEIESGSTTEQGIADEAESRASAANIERTLTTAALIPTKAEIEKNEFTFEPYHTIDYFASQGIKLQQSDLSKDKFGKQLKSFTEWLRSMKRLPQSSIEANLDEATQQSIQQIAEHSFEEKDIVTETMAEVWIKQGNKEKAIDTLHKLSLLNPSKSHYFAAKIEQLKA